MRDIGGNLRHVRGQQREVGIVRVQGHYAGGVEDFAGQPVAKGLADPARVHH